MSDGKKLVAALLAVGSVETLRLVDESVFEEDELVVYRFVKTHYRRYGELPTQSTVETETRQRLPNAPEQVSFYLKKVYDRKLFTALRMEFGDLRDALQAFDVERAKEIIDRMKASCRTASPENDVRNLRDAAGLVMRQYEDAHDHPGRAGIPTGWPELDEMMGGYQRGDLISWVARMGIGKTYMLLKQAIFAWLSGYSILIVTMEMTIEQIVRRVLGMESGVNPDYIRKGQLDLYGMRRLNRYVRSIAHYERFNVFAGSFSKKVSDVEVLIHELAPDIVYIDGAYLLRPDNAAKSSQRLERVAEVYDQLKKLTITCDRPIVTTSQFSRQAGKKGKDGSLESVAFTDAIGMHSSLVFSVKEGEAPLERSRRVVEILKGREGETGLYTMNYRFAPMDFSEIPTRNPNAEEGSGDPDWTHGG